MKSYIVALSGSVGLWLSAISLPDIVGVIFQIIIGVLTIRKMLQKNDVGKSKDRPVVPDDYRDSFYNTKTKSDACKK